MVYLEYEEQKLKYQQSHKKYDEILSEKEALFSMTQPKSVQFDKERVSGGDPSNTFEEYIIQKEKKRIDERLAEARSLLIERETLLRIKEDELRESKELDDRLYVARVLDHMKMPKLTRFLNYSESHIYRMLGEIYSEIKKMRENERINMLKYQHRSL